jgi:hypothetical protein
MSNPYVINLDRRTDRWQQLQQEWKGAFQLTRISAVETSPGGVGCTLSHIKICEEAKARGDPYVLVWEDDCSPRKRDPRTIRALWEEVLGKLVQHRDQWDIVLGATSEAPLGATKNPILTTPNVTVFDLPQGFTTHWTFYNNTCYDKMIEWKAVRQPQNDVYIFQNFRVKVTLPFLAEQKSGFSDLVNNQTNYTQFFDAAERKIEGTIHRPKTLSSLIRSCQFNVASPRFMTR